MEPVPAPVPPSSLYFGYSPLYSPHYFPPQYVPQSHSQYFSQPQYFHLSNQKNSAHHHPQNSFQSFQARTVNEAETEQNQLDSESSEDSGEVVYELSNRMKDILVRGLKRQNQSLFIIFVSYTIRMD